MTTLTITAPGSHDHDHDHALQRNQLLIEESVLAVDVLKDRHFPSLRVINFVGVTLSSVGLENFLPACVTRLTFTDVNLRQTVYRGENVVATPASAAAAAVAAVTHDANVISITLHITGVYDVITGVDNNDVIIGIDNDDEKMNVAVLRGLLWDAARIRVELEKDDLALGVQRMFENWARLEREYGYSCEERRLRAVSIVQQYAFNCV